MTTSDRVEQLTTELRGAAQARERSENAERVLDLLRKNADRDGSGMVKHFSIDELLGSHTAARVALLELIKTGELPICSQASGGRLYYRIAGEDPS